MSSFGVEIEFVLWFAMRLSMEFNEEFPHDRYFLQQCHTVYSSHLSGIWLAPKWDLCCVCFKPCSSCPSQLASICIPGDKQIDCAKIGHQNVGQCCHRSDSVVIRENYSCFHYFFVTLHSSMSHCFQYKMIKLPLFLSFLSFSQASPLPPALLLSYSTPQFPVSGHLPPGRNRLWHGPPSPCRSLVSWQQSPFSWPRGHRAADPSPPSVITKTCHRALATRVKRTDHWTRTAVKVNTRKR